MKTKRLFLLAPLVLFCVPAAGTISWMYPSPLTVVETISDIAGGEYLYEYSFTNVDTSPIWDFGVYTTFPAQPASEFDGHDWILRYGEMDDVLEELDARNLDSNLFALTFASYEGGAQGDPSDSLQVDEPSGGFAFTSTIHDASPKYYFYCTIASGPYWDNGTGEVAAVGTTIPEPSGVLLLALGAISLKRWRRIQ